MDKSNNKIGLYFNIAILLLEIYSIFIYANHYGLHPLAFYTVISNYIAMASSGIYLISYFTGRFKKVSTISRLASTMLLVITFLIVILVLVWFVDPVYTLFTDSSCIRHLIAPILSLISYSYFENHVQNIVEILPTFVISIIYCAIMVTLNALGKIDGPYPFFMVGRFGLPFVILCCVGILIVMIPIGLILYKLPFVKKSKNK